MKAKIMGAAGVVLALILLALSSNIFETNTAGHFQVKQAAMSGKLTVRFQPGLYLQNFGDIETYKNVATIGFGKEEGEGIGNIASIPVIFNDGSKADISGLVRIRLPQTAEAAKELKKQFSGGFTHFLKSGVLPIVRNAVKLSANLRSAQDAYTTLAIFQQAVEDQLKNGPYLTKSDTIVRTKATGDKEVVKVTVIVKDEHGNPKRLSNRLAALGCEVMEAVIDIPEFDSKVVEMINKRKEEAMKTELAKQAALRAKQDAITAEEQGKADIAKAEADALVTKKEAIVKAQQAKEVAELAAAKKYQVAKLAALEAKEVAKRIKAEGEAKAAANKALVKAGLNVSPLC